MVIATSSSGRMYGLGRQPDDPRRPRLRLRALRGARLDPPESKDWQSAVPDYPMLLNDRIGCCVAASAGHACQSVNWYGQSRNEPVSEQAVLAMYSAISGYDPRTGANDNGALLIDGLKYWHRNGLDGNKIAAYAQLDPRDLDLVRACIAIFGNVYCGFMVPESALDQFDQRQPWTVTGHNSRIVGGHAVKIGAYGRDWFECVTWSERQRMSVDFFRRYFDEVWVPIDLDWITTAGTSPDGLDIATLNREYTELTGEPGPFPNVSPTPPAPPTPPINPPVDPAPVPANISEVLRDLLIRYKAGIDAQSTALASAIAALGGSERPVHGR